MEWCHATIFHNLQIQWEFGDSEHMDDQKLNFFGQSQQSNFMSVNGQWLSPWLGQLGQLDAAQRLVKLALARSIKIGSAHLNSDSAKLKELTQINCRNLRRQLTEHSNSNQANFYSIAFMSLSFDTTLFENYNNQATSLLKQLISTFITILFFICYIREYF